MSALGTKIYCPSCESVKICRAISPTELGESSGQRYYLPSHDDLRWFRRGRECQTCFHLFLTAELEEEFIDELAKLRKLVMSQRDEIAHLKEELTMAGEGNNRKSQLQLKADELRKKVPWLYGSTKVPYAAVHDLVARSAWWIRHPSSDQPVRAKRHADRLDYDGEFWRVGFGGNSFLPELLIQRSRSVFTSHLNSVLEGNELNEDLLADQLKAIATRCVSNHEGELYNGSYPLQGEDMVFGTQSIDVHDIARTLVGWSGINSLSRSTYSESQDQPDLAG